MNKFRKGAALCFLLGCGLLLLHFLSFVEAEETVENKTEVNLALRQTVHNLYKIAGDDTSRILPVEQPTERSFRVKIDREINYDTLPKVLDDALKSFDIQQEYIVSIVSCEQEIVLLGYNFSSFERNEVACLGRKQVHICSILHVMFRAEMKKAAIPYLPFALFSFLVSSIALFLSFSIFKKKQKTNRVTQSASSAIQIGSSFFDPKNLSIAVNGKQKSLTFRESKLLEYFALRPNQVLKREDIQDNVWSEEGVIVGRSLDVFISRLRKILRGDEALAIKNIHGVGYRLEVN